MLKATAVVFAIYLVIMAFGFFVVPGPYALWIYMGYTLLNTALYPVLALTMPTILGNAIDYDEWKTGKNRSGQYYAFLVLIQKANTAVGSAAGFALVAAFGYQIGAAHNGELATLGLRLSYSVIPALIVVPAIWWTWKFPIAGKRHDAIQKRLVARARRTSAGGGVMTAISSERRLAKLLEENSERFRVPGASLAIFPRRCHTRRRIGCSERRDRPEDHHQFDVSDRLHHESLHSDSGDATGRGRDGSILTRLPPPIYQIFSAPTGRRVRSSRRVIF